MPIEVGGVGFIQTSGHAAHEFGLHGGQLSIYGAGIIEAARLPVSQGKRCLLKSRGDGNDKDVARIWSVTDHDSGPDLVTAQIGERNRQ